MKSLCSISVSGILKKEFRNLWEIIILIYKEYYIEIGHGNKLFDERLLIFSFVCKYL